MGYFLDAWVAKREVLEKANVRFRPLPQGFGITTDEHAESKISRTKPSEPYAYLFASFFGGGGEQESRVYYADSFVDAFGPDYDAVDAALKKLGVVRSEDSDEFDALGLGAERDNDWIFIPEDDPYSNESD